MSMVDAVRVEAVSLKSKGLPTQRAIEEGSNMVLDKAETLREEREAYGSEAMVRLFGSLEESLRTYMRADAKRKAQDKALDAIASKLSADASPADVQTAFAEAVEEATVADNEALEASFEPLKKLRKLARDASGGAGSSGGGDDDELGEDGFAMTQTARSTKCALLQVEMQAEGELRPVKGPCGHCFSFKAILAHYGAKARADLLKECPQAGCNRKFTRGEFVDDKELIKVIKKAGRID